MNQRSKAMTLAMELVLPQKSPVQLWGGKESLSMQVSLTSDDVGREDSAAPAVAGLAAYLMPLDQYRARILVARSVARDVRDLIKSLAYAHLHFNRRSFGMA